MNKKSSWHLWIGIVISVLASLYSVMGIAMAYWLSAVPGISHERVTADLAVWVPATIICVAISGVIIYRLVVRYKMR